MSSTVVLSGLARRLVKDGIISDEIAQEAFQTASNEKQPFVNYLVSQDLANGMAIAEAASHEFGTPLFNLNAINMEMAPNDLVDIKLIKQHHALPLYRRGNRLFLAVSDPTNLRALDEIKFHTGINTDAILVEENALSEAINKFLESQDTDIGGFQDFDESGLEDLDIEAVSDDADDNDQGADIDETPIVRFVNKVLVDAIKAGASDIHFEPYEKSYRVRFRTDGILEEVTRPPMNLAGRLAARLKVMSQMDISERRMPQDGRNQNEVIQKSRYRFSC